MRCFTSSILLALLAVTSLATSFDDAIAYEKRQANTTGGSVVPTSTAVTSPTRITSGGTVIESSTVVVSPTSVIVSVSSVTSTVTPSSSGTSSASTSVTTSASSATYEVSISSFVTSVSTQVVQTITMTSNGQVVTASRTVNTVVPVSTSARVTGSLLSDSSNGGSAGLSDKSKQIIGGVVGGVGGALLLGALGFTAWRIWGKKKTLHDDDLYDPNSQQEKLNTSTQANQNTPFQSTLDQYHRPGPVNTAANF